MAVKGYLATIDDTASGAIPVQKLREHEAWTTTGNFIALEEQEVADQQDVILYQASDEKTNDCWVEFKTYPGSAYPQPRFIQRRNSFTGGSILEELISPVGYWGRGQVEIYPGYSVSSIEYERRFKGVGLDHFRKVMAPDLFKTYVQTMGSIEGWGIEPQHRYKGKD